MLRKLFSHTAIYGLAPQITRVASVLSLPIITQYLTEVDFGVYGIITAVAGSMAVLNTLGLRIILVNTFYKSPQQFKWRWRQIYGFLILWNFPYSLLLWLILWWFVPQEAIEHRWAIIALNIAPAILFGPTSIIGIAFFQLKQRPLQIAVRSAIFGLITVMLNIYFIAVLRLGYMGWFISTGISTILSQASYFIPVNFKLKLTPIFNFKWRYIRQSLTTSLPTVPHYYASYLLETSDRLIMKVVGISTGNIGLYNAAYTIGNLFKQLGTAAGFAISPLMNASYKDGDDLKARNLVFVLQVGYFMLTFMAAIWLKEIFQLLLKNRELQSTYPIGIIILMAYNYRPMYLGANNKLFYEEKTKSLLKVTFIAGLLNVILNFSLIPFFGYKAAAINTFISLMYMGYSGYYLSASKRINKVPYYQMIWLGITIFLTITSFFIVETGIAVKIILSFFVLILGVLFIRKFSS
ncbi:lipopolysaccharide biosynthesis protein [Parapedobacter lycopersici]|uniref:lipopolysaccharide biosynthesis protein n=1 Tax=Parapedobacter lycopersici TaxID=1864939 RepID=UPI00214DE24D|nr:oligosaccharide flippase family protein [Parapedobacter lycopersici]